MEYKKKSTFTMVNGNETIDLVIGNIYRTSYDYANEKKIKVGRLVNVDDGEEPFSTYNEPSLTLDTSEKYHKESVDIRLKQITDIKLEYGG